MTKKRKFSREETSQVVEVIEEKDVLTYQAFFQRCLTRGLVRHWQENEIKAFFKDSGLSEKEPLDKYVDALSKY